MGGRDAKSVTLGLAAVLFGACVLGFAAPLVKLSDMGPQAIGFWRMFLAIPAVALWLVLSPKPKPSDPPAAPGAWKALTLAGVFFAGDLAFWHAGIKITTAANATLLANLQPVFVVLGAWLLFGERITRRFLIAAGIALAGAALLSAANITIAPERLLGDILSAVTALWYAAYLLAVRAARGASSTARVMLWTSLVASPILLAVTLASGETLMPQGWAQWWPLLALGLGVHVLGQGGLAFGLGRAPAALASVFILVQPVVSAIAGWLMFGETLIAVQFLGAALVLAGVWLARTAGGAASSRLAKPRPKG